MTSYFPITKYIIVWNDLYSNLNLHVYSVWNYADITYYNVFSAKLGQVSEWLLINT
jgi:hypothetical protein